MRKALILTLCFLFLQGGAKADPVTFLSQLEDVPLMPGLKEAQGGMHFDTPAGRIVESYAVGGPSTEDILTFYKTSLPSLGWREIGGDAFEREGEILSLSIVREQNQAVVRFALSPKS